MLDIVMVFIVSFVATALSSMSGGGASVITIPALLLMGVSFPLATAAQKVSSTFWVLPAAYNYLKDRKVDWRFIFLFSGIGLLGVYAGVSLVVLANPRVMQIIIGILILVLVTYTFFKKDIGITDGKIFSKLRQRFSYVFALILGFYEGIFGAGNGIMFAIVTLKTKGFDFIDALGYYFAVAFSWVFFAAVILISKGYFSWSIMIPTVIGSVIGGYVGSRYAKYKGNKFIKIMFVVVGGILGIKLLVGF